MLSVGAKLPGLTLPVQQGTSALPAVAPDRPLTVAPLSISMRRGTPLMVALAQKWPSGESRMRTSLPLTCCRSRPRLAVIRPSVG